MSFFHSVAAGLFRPVGSPIAASEAQQAQIVKHHKAGRSVSINPESEPAFHRFLRKVKVALMALTRV